MNKMMITINKPKLMKNAGKLGDLFSSTYHFQLDMTAISQMD